MINFQKNEVTFLFRIAGITVHNNHVLLHRMIEEDFWALPGGRCELLEFSSDALIREYKEEIDIDVEIERVLFMVENFFQSDHRQYHEISLIYNVLIPKKSKCLDLNEFLGKEQGKDLLFKWFDINQLSNVKLYPSFLRKEIVSLPKEIKHILHRDN